MPRPPHGEDGERHGEADGDIHADDGGEDEQVAAAVALGGASALRPCRLRRAELDGACNEMEFARW